MGTSVKVVTLSAFYMEFYALMWDMRWLMLLSLVLVVADLWYGISKARRRKEEVRISRAIRRTLIKIGDYICVIILAAVLGKAIGQPLGIDYSIMAVCCMCLACYCELESVIAIIANVKVSIITSVCGVWQKDLPVLKAKICRK
mgnify:CR=1 FL=1